MCLRLNSWPCIVAMPCQRTLRNLSYKACDRLSLPTLFCSLSVSFHFLFSFFFPNWLPMARLWDLQFPQGSKSRNVSWGTWSRFLFSSLIIISSDLHYGKSRLRKHFRCILENLLSAPSLALLPPTANWSPPHPQNIHVPTSGNLTKGKGGPSRAGYPESSHSRVFRTTLPL